MSPLTFNEVGHIEIDVAEVSGVILFHILHIVEIEHKLVNTVAVKYDIKGIINEIDVNYGLKGAVETVAEPPYIKLPIDFTEVPDIHVKLLLKLEPDVVRGQLVKEFR